MPIYQIDTQKQLGTEYWTNVWHVLAEGVAGARISAEVIMDAELANSHADVKGVSYRVALYPLAGGQGTIVPFTQVGGQVAYDYLPLFNVVRIDWSTGEGRPSRKYMKFPTGTSWVTNGNLDASMVLAFQNNIANYLLAEVPELCNIHGENLTIAQVFTPVAMRQLRRGSKRKLGPVIPTA